MTEREAIAKIDRMIKLLKEQITLYYKMREGIVQHFEKRNKR
jgi:hypothetical protein